MLTTVDLEYLLKNNDITQHAYKGCFARDRLPTRDNEKRPSLFILNTDKSSEKGEHWVLIYCPDNYEFDFYFDSFGLPPRTSDILKFLKQNKWTWNPFIVQNLFSTACGFHVLFVSYFLCRGYSFQDVMKKYTPDRTYNDSIVKDFVNSVFVI